MPADYQIRLATAEDAPRVSAMVRRCYEDTYPDRWMLDPEQVARRLRTGSLVYAVAELEGGHVGQSALWPHGSGGLWEVGKTVVDVEHRGQGLMRRLSHLLVDGWAPRNGVKALQGRTVTNHMRVQSHSLNDGFTPLGLLLGLLPKTLSMAGVPDSPHPISFLLTGRCVVPHPRPRRLALVGPELELAEQALDGLGIEARQPGGSSRRPPLGLELERVESLGQLHLRFGAGLPWQSVPHDLVERELMRGTRIIWADVPAEHPQAPWLIDHLRRLGLGVAAYLPHADPSGEDAARLQCYLDEEIPAEGILVREEGRPLRDRVLADQARAPQVAEAA